MIHHIFSKQFYSLITPPNKQDILNNLETAKINPEKSVEWNSNCDVCVESLYPNELLSVLLPSVDIFFGQLGLQQTSFYLNDIWRNIYRKGGHQEVHNHLDVDGKNHISGCIFLDDFDSEAGKFYFLNRYDNEFTPFWRKLYDNNKEAYRGYVVTPQKCDIIFFPSDMLHGVYVHELENPRQTVSFNITIDL